MLEALEKIKDKELKEEYLEFLFNLNKLWEIVKKLEGKEEEKHFYSELINSLEAVDTAFKQVINKRNKPLIAEQKMVNRVCGEALAGRYYLISTINILKEIKFDNNVISQLLTSKKRLDLAGSGFIRSFDTLEAREKFNRDAEKELGIARLVEPETFKRKPINYPVSLYILALSNLRDVASFLQEVKCYKAATDLLVSIYRFELALASFIKTTSNKL